MNRLPLALLPLTACGLFGGKTTDDGPYCEDTPTTIAADEVSALGFSGADLLALAEGSHAATLSYAGGDEAALAIDVTWDAGEVRYVASEAVYPEGDEVPAIGVECPDRLEVDVGLSFVSDDGRFDELWDLTLSATEVEAVRFNASEAPEALGGSLDITEFTDTTDYDEASVDLWGSFTAAGASGSVSLTLSGEESCDGDECVAWGSNEEIATWGGEAEE